MDGRWYRLGDHGRYPAHANLSQALDVKAQMKNNDLNIGSPRWNYHVWMDAKQFLDAGNILFDSDISVCYPMLMNYAFACELALKACDVQTRSNSKQIEGGPIPTGSFKSTTHGHRLVSDVFQKLPLDMQRKIANRFSEIANAELHDQLVIFNDYFVHVRYSFERPARTWDLSGMRNFANALLNATLLGEHSMSNMQQKTDAG